MRDKSSNFHTRCELRKHHFVWFEIKLQLLKGGKTNILSSRWTCWASSLVYLERESSYPNLISLEHLKILGKLIKWLYQLKQIFFIISNCLNRASSSMLIPFDSSIQVSEEFELVRIDFVNSHTQSQLRNAPHTTQHTIGQPEMHLN